jgi:hypothetical protein
MDAAGIFIEWFDYVASSPFVIDEEVGAADPSVSIVFPIQFGVREGEGLGAKSFFNFLYGAVKVLDGGVELFDGGKLRFDFPPEKVKRP